MTKILLSLLLLTLVCSPLAWGDEDSDTRANVTVPTKRQSIDNSDLPRLVQLTEERSPIVRKAKGVLEIAERARANARTTFLPSLDLDATHGYQDGHPSAGKPWNPYASGLNLVLSENLYDNGANFTKLRISDAQYERAKLDFEQQRDQALLNMVQSYLDWSACVRNREIDDNKRDLLKRQYDILEVQYRQGLKTKRDVLRIETEVRRQDLAIITRDNECDLDFQKLAGTIGISHEELSREEIEMVEVKPYASVGETPPELNPKEHRRARILALDQKAADLGSRLVERDYLPQVFLTGATGYHMAHYLGTSNALYQDSSYSWEALVVLKYNLWDFGARRRNVEIAHITATNLAQDNAQALLDLSNDLRDVWNKQREYQESVRLSRELLVLEQQSYNLLETDYRNGRANYLDLIGSLNSLIDARGKLAAAYYGLKKEQMIYAFQKGVLYENLK